MLSQVISSLSNVFNKKIDIVWRKKLLMKNWYNSVEILLIFLVLILPDQNLLISLDQNMLILLVSNMYNGNIGAFWR